MTKRTVIDYNRLAEVANRLFSLPPAFLPRLFLPPCLRLCRVRFWLIVLYARTVSGKRIFKPSTLFILFIFYIKKNILGPTAQLVEILVPQPGIESLPPALAGRFLVTGPPGNSQTPFIFMGYLIHKREHGMEGDLKIENVGPLLSPLPCSSTCFCASSMSSAKKKKKKTKKNTRGQ